MRPSLTVGSAVVHGAGVVHHMLLSGDAPAGAETLITTYSGGISHGTIAGRREQVASRPVFVRARWPWRQASTHIWRALQPDLRVAIVTAPFSEDWKETSQVRQRD